MRKWLSSRSAGAVHAKRFLPAIAIVIAAVCGGSSPSIASSNGKLVVNILPDQAFVEPNASLWIYLDDRPFSHSRLIGRRKVSGNPLHVDRLTVDVAAGNYEVFLLKKESGASRLMITSCFVMVGVASGSETDVDLPAPSGSSCFRAAEFSDPSGLPFRWARELSWGRQSYALSGSGVLPGNYTPPSPDPFWFDLNKRVDEEQAKYCPVISGPLRQLYRKIAADPPTQPIVSVKGPAVGRILGPVIGNNQDLRIEGGNGALADMDMDAELVRLAVADVKARCWNWFYSWAGGYAQYAPPRGTDADLYAEDKEAVKSDQDRLDQLNLIADTLDQIAREQGQP